MGWNASQGNVKTPLNMDMSRTIAAKWKSNRSVLWLTELSNSQSLLTIKKCLLGPFFHAVLQSLEPSQLNRVWGFVVYWYVEIFSFCNSSPGLFFTPEIALAQVFLLFSTPKAFSLPQVSECSSQLWGSSRFTLTLFHRKLAHPVIQQLEQVVDPVTGFWLHP